MPKTHIAVCVVDLLLCTACDVNLMPCTACDFDLLLCAACDVDLLMCAVCGVRDQQGHHADSPLCSQGTVRLNSDKRVDKSLDKTAEIRIVP
jgi:hypothetical protein